MIKKYRYSILLTLALVVGAVCAHQMRSAIQQIEDWNISPEVPYHASPVLAFEYARNAEDVAAVFAGPAQDKVAAMKKATCWDFIFIPAYTGLFIVLTLLLFRHYRKPKRILVWAAVAIGLLDVAENSQLLSIMNALDNTEAINHNAFLLQLFVYPKWTGVALVILALLFGIFLSLVKFPIRRRS